MIATQQPLETPTFCESLSPVAPRGVLIVDPQEMTRTLLALLLRRRGLPCWIARDAAEAQEVCRLHAGQVGVLLLDLHVHGPATLERLRGLNPAACCYFLSAGHLGGIEEPLTAAGVRGVVLKPFLFRFLDDIVQTCLNESN